MTEEDWIYYRRRATEEQRAAEHAACRAAMTAHQMLADQYLAVLETGRLMASRERSSAA